MDPIFPLPDFTVPEIDDLLPDPVCSLLVGSGSDVYTFDGGVPATDNNGAVGRDCFLEGDITTNNDYYFEVVNADGALGTYRHLFY